MKKIILIITLLLLLTSCGSKDENQIIIPQNQKIEVTTSIVPLASMVNYIGGENVRVNSLVPVGVKPQEFGLTPEHLIGIQKSDMVFLLGIQDIDGFLFTSLSGVKSIALDAGLQVLDATNEHNHTEHSDEMYKYLADEGEGHIHVEASIDSYVWTGKVNSLLMAKRIEEELSLIQPSNADIFEENYERFETVLTVIFDDFTSRVEGKTQNEFIVFNDAYNYLFYDVGIDTNKKLAFNPNVLNELNSVKMRELSAEVQLHGIQQFYVEPGFESTALTALAQENNAEIIKLDSFGNSIDGGNFIENISTNLEALVKIYE